MLTHCLSVNQISRELLNTTTLGKLACMRFMFGKTSLPLVTGSNARSATRQYLSYSEADFEVFCPQGRQLIPMGAKFGME